MRMMWLTDRKLNVATVIFTIFCIFEKTTSKNIYSTDIDEHTSVKNLNFYDVPNGTEGNERMAISNIRTVTQSNERKPSSVIHKTASEVMNISNTENPDIKFSSVSSLVINSSSSSLEVTNGSSNLGSQVTNSSSSSVEGTNGSSNVGSQVMNSSSSSVEGTNGSSNLESEIMNSSSSSIEDANRFSNHGSHMNASIEEANRSSNSSFHLMNHASISTEETETMFRNKAIQSGNSTYMNASVKNDSTIEDSILTSSNITTQSRNITQNFNQIIQNISNTVSSNESVVLVNDSSHEYEDLNLILQNIFNESLHIENIIEADNVSSKTISNITEDDSIEIPEVAMSMSAKMIMNDEEAIEFLIKQEMGPFKCFVTSDHNTTVHEELNERNDTEKHLKNYFITLHESPYTNMDWKTHAKLGRVKKYMQDRHWLGRIIPYYLRGLSKKFWRKKYPLMGFLGLKREFAASKNYNELQYYWTKWSDITGKSMKKKFLTYVQLNKIYDRKMDGRESLFIKEQDDLRMKIDSLYQEILPLYRRFHSYVRKRLLVKYGHRRINRSGPIPAHLLGDISAHDWTNIENLLRPYPNKAALEICKNIKERNISAKSIAEIAEDFYASLGFSTLDKKFWDNSIFESLSINCTDSLSVKCDNDSIGLHACFDPDCYFFSMFHWTTLAQQLKHNTIVSPAISEAIANTIILSTSKPGFLYSSGLLNIMIYDTHDEINFLMETALRIIPSMMDSLSVGLWKQRIMERTKQDRHMNENFWKHRLYYQGLCPPVVRSERNFDAGAVKSITDDLNVMKEFLSGFLQFQIYKSLCNASGHGDVLHRCDLRNSAEAGKRIRKLLNFGKPVTIKDALSVLTDGDEEIRARPLIEYFKPLYEWFLKQDEFDIVGWESYDATVCPKCAF